MEGFNIEKYAFGCMHTAMINSSLKLQALMLEQFRDEVELHYQQQPPLMYQLFMEQTPTNEEKSDNG